MKIILPVAGMGTRLRPQTCFLPKALLPVGGNCILGHILDSFDSLVVSEYIFTTGYKSELLEEYVRTLNIPHRFVKQEDPQGLGEAISLCTPFLSDDEPVLIVLGDTLFEADLNELTSRDHNALCTRQVDNPDRFGVAVADASGTITKLVEKPSEFVSDQALVGIYWIKDTTALKSSLDQLIREDIRTRGEYQLTDALVLMMESGTEFKTASIIEWLDCGKPETLLATNAKVLKGQHFVAPTAQLENCTIIEPCHISEDVVAKNSILGPNLSLFKGCQVQDSHLSESVIDQNSQIISSKLSDAIVGKECYLERQKGRMSIGDFTHLGGSFN